MRYDSGAVEGPDHARSNNERDLGCLGSGIHGRTRRDRQGRPHPYMGYRPEDLVELDVRAQSACTYCHMLSEADRRLIDRDGIRPLEIKGGLKVWLVESANVVI